MVILKNRYFSLPWKATSNGTIFCSVSFAKSIINRIKYVPSNDVVMISWVFALISIHINFEKKPDELLHFFLIYRMALWAVAVPRLFLFYNLAFHKESPSRNCMPRVSSVDLELQYLPKAAKFLITYWWCVHLFCFSSSFGCCFFSK